MEELEEYGVEVELDPLAQSVDISTPLDSVHIDVDPYGNAAYIYTGRGVFRCRDLKDITVVVEEDAIFLEHGGCERVV